MKKLDKKIIIIAAVLGAITIAIGAFGAHGLKEIVSTEALSTFETGVRYQMYHVIALLILGLLTGITEKTKLWVLRFFLFGILFFSGSIYLLSTQEFWALNAKILGPLTPIGGLLLIVGWLRLAYGVFKIK